MKSYIDFYNKYKDIFDIINIYILEAHFIEKDEKGNITNGWPIGYKNNYPQHKTLDDRIKMAQLTIDKYNIPFTTYIDSFDNQFNNVYKVWPDRAYVIFKGKMCYISTSSEDGFRLKTWTEEIEELYLS